MAGQQVRRHSSVGGSSIAVKVGRIGRARGAKRGPHAASLAWCVERHIAIFHLACARMQQQHLPIVNACCCLSIYEIKFVLTFSTNTRSHVTRNCQSARTCYRQVLRYSWQRQSTVCRLKPTNKLLSDQQHSLHTPLFAAHDPQRTYLHVVFLSVATCSVLAGTRLDCTQVSPRLTSPRDHQCHGGIDLAMLLHQCKHGRRHSTAHRYQVARAIH